MSAPKFTPGPWGQYDADPLIIIKPDDGSSLGEMSAGSPQMSRGEQLANARLAAAAPELYEALDQLRTVMACHDSTPEEFLALSNAVNALAKAVQP
jgi:hypothetical protein